nr:unnamed protein product [Digitaria exilis]
MDDDDAQTTAREGMASRGTTTAMREGTTAVALGAAVQGPRSRRQWHTATLRATGRARPWGGNATGETLLKNDFIGQYEIELKGGHNFCTCVNV